LQEHPPNASTSPLAKKPPKRLWYLRTHSIDVSVSNPDTADK
jgi:hypothetical protein